MTGLQRKRLLAVATTMLGLTKSERKRFNMETWATESPGCATVGCAVGFCLLKKTLPGLRLSMRPSGIRGVKHGDPRMRGGLSSWAAVEQYFGLSGYDTAHLFGPNSYNGDKTTPLQVAERIVGFVAEREEA